MSEHTLKYEFDSSEETKYLLKNRKIVTIEKIITAAVIGFSVGSLIHLLIIGAYYSAIMQTGMIFGFCGWYLKFNTELLLIDSQILNDTTLTVLRKIVYTNATLAERVQSLQKELTLQNSTAAK